MQSAIQNQTKEVAAQLQSEGIGRGLIQPGDSTAYHFVIIDQHSFPGLQMQGSRYVVGWSFGRLQTVPDHFQLSPGYAERFVEAPYLNAHTVGIYCAILSEVGRHLGLAHV